MILDANDFISISLIALLVVVVLFALIRIFLSQRIQKQLEEEARYYDHEDTP